MLELTCETIDIDKLRAEVYELPQGKCINLWCVSHKANGKSANLNIASAILLRDWLTENITMIQTEQAISLVKGE